MPSPAAKSSTGGDAKKVEKGASSKTPQHTGHDSKEDKGGKVHKDGKAAEGKPKKSGMHRVSW